MTKGEWEELLLFFHGARRVFPFLLSKTSLFNVLHVFFLHKWTTLSFLWPKNNKLFYVSWEKTENEFTVWFCIHRFQRLSLFPDAKIWFFVISWVACSGSHLQRSVLYCFFYLFICFPSQPVLQLIDIILLRRLNDIPDCKERQIRVQINGNVINAYCYPPCSTRLTEQKLQMNKKKEKGSRKRLKFRRISLEVKNQEEFIAQNSVQDERETSCNYTGIKAENGIFIPRVLPNWFSPPVKQEFWEWGFEIAKNKKLVSFLED